MLHGPEHGYFASLAVSLLEQSHALSSLFTTVPARWAAVATAVSKFGASLTSRSALRRMLMFECAGDLLCYCNDVLDLEIEGINDAMSQALWQVRFKRMSLTSTLPDCVRPQDLIEPLLLALHGDADVDQPTQPLLAPVAALFILTRLCHSLTNRPLLKKLIVALMGVSEGANARSRILEVVRACCPRDIAASALCLLSVLASNRFADDAALGALLLLECTVA